MEHSMVKASPFAVVNVVPLELGQERGETVAEGLAESEVIVEVDVEADFEMDVGVDVDVVELANVLETVVRVTGAGMLVVVTTRDETTLDTVDVVVEAADEA